MPNSAYEIVIGLEVHLQLATQSKAFCGDDTRFGGSPNTQVSPISLGHPGTLPRLNARQVEYAVRLALALRSDINRTNAFDRKNYFYADLPKGYQITQDRKPICTGGVLPIKVDGAWKPIRIHHVHMEEDAGKSIHNLHPTKSLIDLNRAGTPLLEIVTEPDLRSAQEVDAFMSGIRQLARYIGVSDGNMEEGSLRCDVNVSVRKKGENKLNERCEIKNLNSMRYARQAIDFESKRQIALMESGQAVQQQTLNFDPNSGQTAALREKEDAHDYRYFPEPDLPPVRLSEAFLGQIGKEMPALPWETFEVLCHTHGLSDYDAGILFEERERVLYFEALIAHTPHKKAAANLLINRLLPYCQEKGLALADFPLSPAQLGAFIALIDSGRISHSAAQQRLLPAWLESPEVSSPEDLAAGLDLLQVGGTDVLSALAEEVIGQFPDKVKAYKSGKKGLLGFFMGELMKRSQGKADPAKATQLLQELLGG